MRFTVCCYFPPFTLHRALSLRLEIGEVWATILHGVLTSLVHNHGFNASVGTQPDGTEGNIVYLHLFIDALSLQPCNPTSKSLPCRS